MKLVSIAFIAIAALFCIAAAPRIDGESKWEYMMTSEQELLEYAHAKLTEAGKIDEPMIDGEGTFSVQLTGFLKDGGYEYYATMHLQELGEDGWELVSVDGGNFWLKRPHS